MLCGIAYAATPLYVDPSATDDTGTGLIGDPKKSIKDAYANVDDGGTVLLVAGTYDDATQIWEIRTLEKSVTIEPAVSGSRISLTRQAEGLTGWWYIVTDYTGYGLTFNDIDFVSTRAGGVIFLFADAGHNITQNNCTWNVTANGFVVTNANASIKSIEKRFQATDCTLIDSATTVNPLKFPDGFALVDLDNCIVASSNAVSTERIIKISSSLGPVNIRNCEFTGNWPVWIQSNDYPSMSAIIEDCTFNSLVPAGVFTGNAIQLGPGEPATPATNTIRNTRIINNKIIGYDQGMIDTADETVVIGNVFDCADDIWFYGTKKPVMINNTFVGRGINAGRVRNIMLARTWKSPYVAKADTSFTANTVVSGAAWNLANVEADGITMIAMTTTDVDTPPVIYYGIVAGVNDGTDTVTVDKWIEVANGNVVTPADATYHAVAYRWSEFSYSFNNIFARFDNHSCMTFDFNPLPGNHIMDYNCYDIVAKVSNLGTDTISTLAQQQAKWQEWPMDTYKLAGAADSWYVSLSITNDLNSIQTAPQLDANYRPQNSQLIEGGKPDTNGKSTSIGATSPPLPKKGVYGFQQSIYGDN
jgi:hypothetical protein